jgi:hypothetical protein
VTDRQIDRLVIAIRCILWRNHPFLSIPGKHLPMNNMLNKRRQVQRRRKKIVQRNRNLEKDFGIT